jgi:hypothetical protein
MTEAERIAAGLSEAQKAAVCGRYAWASLLDEWNGEKELYRLGLWNPKPKHGEKAITPLGLAVRKVLERSNDTD